MEDGSSMPLWGLFVLLLLLWLNGIFYGFAAALRNISENDTQKKAEEGDNQRGGQRLCPLRRCRCGVRRPGKDGSCTGAGRIDRY